MLIDKSKYALVLKLREPLTMQVCSFKFHFEYLAIIP